MKFLRGMAAWCLLFLASVLIALGVVLVFVADGVKDLATLCAATASDLHDNIEQIIAREKQR